MASPPLLPRASNLAVKSSRACGLTTRAKNDQNRELTVVKSETEWAEQLSREQFYILRQKGTERPGTGTYDAFYPDQGYFACAGCDSPLYSAAAKFSSGCGWPAFDKTVEGALVTKTDRSVGMVRVEIMCGSCGGHLGHVFEGEHFTPTNERHCVNSLAIKYVDSPLPESTREAKVLDV